MRTRAYRIAFLLFVCVVWTPAHGVWKCRDWLRRDSLQNDLALSKHIELFDGLNGRHLSPTQVRLRHISLYIDYYLLLGDIGPIITRYSRLMRETELTYLKWQALSEREKPQAELVLGRLFLEWKHIRKHLEDWMKSEEYGLAAVKNQEQAIAALHKRAIPEAALEHAAAPPTLSHTRHRHLQQQRALLDSLQNGITSQIEQLQAWHTYLERHDEGHVRLKNVGAFLQTHKHLGDGFRELLSRRAFTPDAKQLLKEELELRVERLQTTQRAARQAFKVYEALGAQDGDFDRFKSEMPVNGVLATGADLTRLVYYQPVAYRAMKRKERWDSFWGMIDGLVFKGPTGAVLPTVLKGVDSIHPAWLRRFVTVFVKGLYQINMENKYLPHLILLRRAQGGVKQLRAILENFNSGTNDQLLISFARSDMATLWQTIKAEAKRTEEDDHKKLYQRMCAAEERALELGSMSMIHQQGYGGYLVSGVLNGAIYALAAKSIWWIAQPGAEGLWSLLFGPTSMKRKAPSFWESLTNLFFPQAYATPPEPALESELFGYTEETEEAVFETAQALLTNLQIGTSGSATAAAAALKLYALEKSLEGR